MKNNVKSFKTQFTGMRKQVKELLRQNSKDEKNCVRKICLRRCMNLGIMCGSLK